MGTPVHQGSQREQIEQHNPAVRVGQGRVVDIPPVRWAAGAAKTAEIAAVADTARAAWGGFESCPLPSSLCYCRLAPMQAAAAFFDPFYFLNHYPTLDIY